MTRPDSSPTNPLTATFQQEVEAADLAQHLHQKIMSDKIHDDEHYAMVWAAAFVQGLLDDGWKFYRE